MAIDVLVVDLIPANAIELFGNRAQANTNRSGEEFNYRTQTNTNHRLSWILLADYFTLLYSTLLYSTLLYSTLLFFNYVLFYWTQTKHFVDFLK